MYNCPTEPVCPYCISGSHPSRKTLFCYRNLYDVRQKNTVTPPLNNIDAICLMIYLLKFILTCLINNICFNTLGIHNAITNKTKKAKRNIILKAFLKIIQANIKTSKMPFILLTFFGFWEDTSYFPLPV